MLTHGGSERSRDSNGAVWINLQQLRKCSKPVTYQGQNGKQYVAIVAGPELKVLAVP